MKPLYFFLKHFRVLKKDKNGSVLIFSLIVFVVASLVVASATQSTRKLTKGQNDLITYQQKKAFLDSYISYLRSNSDDLTEQKNAYFGDIDYTLSKQVENIDGFLDNGEVDTYDFSQTRNIIVEWNKCISAGQQGAIQIDADGSEELKKANTSDNCSNTDAIFDDSYKLKDVTKLTLSTWDSPINYRITSNDTSPKLPDNKWHLNYKIKLDGYGNILEGVEIFE